MYNSINWVGIQMNPITKIYTDQTGQFTIPSSTGSQYIMCAYINIPNSIIIEKINKHSAQEIIK